MHRRILGRSVIALGALLTASLVPVGLAGPASGDVAGVTSGEVISAGYLHLSPRPRARLVEGSVVADYEGCDAGVRAVHIERARTQRVVARSQTERDSTFHFTDIDLRPGRYRVVRPEVSGSDDDGPVTCLEAVSRAFGIRVR